MRMPQDLTDDKPMLTKFCDAIWRPLVTMSLNDRYHIALPCTVVYMPNSFISTPTGGELE